MTCQPEAFIGSMIGTVLVFSTFAAINKWKFGDWRWWR